MAKSTIQHIKSRIWPFLGRWPDLRGHIDPTTEDLRGWPRTLNSGVNDFVSWQATRWFFNQRSSPIRSQTRRGIASPIHPLCCRVEVFTGQIFSPYSNPPQKAESKSIPPQIQNLKGLTQLWKSRRIYPKYMPKCSVGSTDHVCKFLFKNFA